MTFDKFTIRQISTEDLHSYFDFIENNRDRISKYFPKTSTTTKDIQLTKLHIADRISKAKKQKFITLVIVDNITKAIIGAILIKDIDWVIPKGELGYFIDKNYEGTGIITKSLSLVIAYCFQTLKLNKVFMRISDENISSKRVAEKNKFKVEGTLRNDFKTFDGKLIDTTYYGLLKEEFGQ